jgi:hypothetical protein
MGGQESYLNSKNDRYEGNYHTEPELCHGYVTCHFVNGDYYKGEWQHGQMWGDGVCIYANGDEYMGHFYANQRHGVGLYIATEGWSYQGEWVDDLMEGVGQMSGFNQVTYEGYWSKGFKHGIGQLVYPDGHYYVARWNQGMMEDGITELNETYYPFEFDSETPTEIDSEEEDNHFDFDEDDSHFDFADRFEAKTTPSADQLIPFESNIVSRGFM